MTARSRIRTILVLGLVFALVGAGIGPAVAAGASQGHQATNQVDDCTFPVTKTDATGTEVTIDAEPETVVTLSGSAAQTMWEIGAKEKVIGVSQYASYLQGTDERTKISGADQSFVVTEKVVNLDPDLVLAPNIIPDETVNALREAGLTVYKFESATSLEAVVEKTRLTGQLVGECEGADERATEMRESLDSIEAAVEDSDSPRVLYVMGGGYTAGNGTFINEIIETAGGTNVAAEAGIEYYGAISEEIVVSEDPEWIITNTDIGAIPQTEAYNQTTAVQNDQVRIVDANYVSQPAPRTVEVVEELARSFHPDAFEASTETATAESTTASETTGAEQTTDETDAGTTEVTTATTPGMGIPVAVLALVLVGLSLRRE
jgi:iron complex transport system substrate-binding protein